MGKPLGEVERAQRCEDFRAFLIREETRCERVLQFYRDEYASLCRELGEPIDMPSAPGASNGR